MTPTQERAITLSLNILHVGFFECPGHYYEYFVNNDEWALLMAAGGVNAAATPAQELALAVLRHAVARDGLFAEMTDFAPPARVCSFLRDKITTGERTMNLEPCQPGQRGCPYATFVQIKHSGKGPAKARGGVKLLR